MKTKSPLTRRSMILALTLALLTGFVLTVPAGDRSQSPRPRETSQVRRDTGMNSLPRPVVDETPINPGTYGNQKKGTARGDRGQQPRDQHKRRNVRR